MREFVDACNKEPMVLKWNSRMLTWACADKLNLKETGLLDINTGQSSLDIFQLGNESWRK